MDTPVSLGDTSINFWQSTTSRLGRVIGVLVAQNLSAFNKDKHLADSVVVVNDVVDYANNISKEFMIFKVDFENACHSLSKLWLLRTLKCLRRASSSTILMLEY